MDKSTRIPTPLRVAQAQRHPQAHLIQSVAKALRILDAFTAQDPDLNLQQIAGRLGLNQNTLFPILQTLTAFGYLTKDPVTRRYRLGLKLLERGAHLRELTELIRVADPHLTALTKASQENSHLAVLDRDEVVYLARKEAAQALMIQSRVGKRVPPHCTALGKVLLAGLTQEEFEATLQRLPLIASTLHTITERNTLRREIAKAREQGYALDQQEYQEGGVCVAAPVLDSQGRVVAAVSLSMPLVRCNRQRLAELRVRVQETCHAISSDLGYVAGPSTASGRQRQRR